MNAEQLGQADITPNATTSSASSRSSNHALVAENAGIVVYNSSMDPLAIQEALDSMFDQALMYHGYVDYMRDYELIVYATADPRTGIAPAYLRYLFRYCVEASSRTTLSPDVWGQSLDDRLIDYDSGVDLDGYVWGVKWHCLYPGAQIVSSSDAASRWTQALGIPFHEVRVETNAHDLTLIFSDIQVSELSTGYAPYVVPDRPGPDHKYVLE